MVDSKQQWKAWLYLAPAIALLLVFTVWPIINTVRMSFLENYSSLEATAGEAFAIGMVFAAMFNIVGAFYGTEKELIVTGILKNYKGTVEFDAGCTLG